ncbi:Transketolase, partial [Durusdinium trenchii]
MRRYGWERHLDESAARTWMETFEAVKKAEDWSRFAWFLVAHLLHPACRESLRAWHNPVTVLESRLDRSGIAQEVVTLHDDLLAWQDLHGCSSLPEKKQHADLAKRVGKYFNSREARVRTLQKAYPPDFAPLPGYRVECLSLEGDSLRGVLWRSAAERALMFSIPGWREEGKGKEEFHPLQDFCKHWLPEADEMECLDLLTNTQRPVTWKLEQVARRLDCSPTFSGAQEALAKRLLRSFPEDAGDCLQKFCCRLCPTDCADAKSFKEHVAQEHAGVGLQDTPRMLIEYRKKILALVPGMSRQRTIAANFDERLRCPAGTSEEGRMEAACVVCARRFWAHELNKVLLFTDPAQAEGLPQLPDGVDAAVRPSQQHRLCRLLGVPRYAERWPHIALEELQKSAVEHPFLPGEYVLLHRRRMPEDARQPSPVCRDCRTSLTAQVLTLPRHALANDLWLGRALPELRSLSAGTKRLLPLVRVCMQVTVLQPVVLPHAERQKGFIGNTIFLPQASPSSVEAVLPPRAEDMAEHILFVLVGHNRGDLRSSATMQAPREEYVAAVERLRQTSKYYAEAAVDLSRWSGQEETMFEGCVLETDADSYLARELLQRGPADAQGQESSQQEEDDAGMAEDTAESGHLISSIVGLNDTSDDENRWLRVCRDVEDLCRRKPRQYDTDAELVVRNRANNDLGVGAAQMEGANLLGREGAHERGVLRRIRQVQTVAAHGVETERQAQGQMFEVRPQKLVVPSRDTPLSMFEPGTWAMAFPTLFPWGDGVPFLKRETSMEASEVFRYLLLREELQYSGEGGVEDEEQLLPTLYDVQRRLTLMRTSKAYVKRSGFGRHCSVIASVTSEHLLKAMALHGEKADIRELLRSPDVGSVLQASSNVLGTEGHRSQIRLRGHAAGWHYGPSHIFVTPNLADSRASLLLQLHLQGGSRVEAYEVDLAWDLEAPALPSLSAMRRILAADPVSQARFFDVMMTLFFEEILGTLPPLTRASFRGGLARDFEDGFAASTHAGCFGDVAAFCGPLETQGRGSMHPHILVVLLGHDLGNRLRSVLATAARGELVIELERWSRAVLQAASRIRYDSQQALSQQLEQEVCPLPLSENQRAACGRQYSDVPLRSTEPDGHEAATESSTPLRLTGCFASLRPHYVRRSKAAAFNAASWSGALCRDYRRLVIQNHFHKCTKSCFKKTLGGNAAKGKRGCRFGCFHVELHKETEDSGLEKVRARCLKGWPRVQRAQFMILPRENVPLEEEEAMKNENPHVFQPQRDHPFEGMSNPIAQVSMRCNVDVKYLGRGFCDADLQKLAANEEDGDGQGGDAQPPDGERKKKDKSLDARLHRVVVDMFRDMQDVQFYTGEYASKKFEVSRSLLPELFAGVQRLEAEEAQRQAAPVPEAAPLPAEVARLRALSLLRRLAFGMQRCVAKSNGEMAYQLLFQQEQLVSYSGYNMFFRFVPYAMFRCRAVALDAAAASAPHLKVLPLEPVEAEETDAIPVQEVAEVFDEEDLTESGIPTGGTRVVSHNQKDDYLHRGASAVMTSMSLVMYSRYVRRELRTADDNVVVPVDLRLPGQNEPEKYAAFMLGLSLPFPRCPGAQHCGEAWQCFHCHEIEKLEGKGFLRACFSKTWKQWKACMQVRKVNAQERLLAGLSLPFLRDVVGLREWRDVSCLDEMLLDGADPEISEEMPAQEPAGEDAEDQGILFPSASTPSFRLHHEARQLSSSQRRAERFAYMTKEEEGEDDDVGPVDIEGSDVENDLEHEDAIERMDCAEHPVSREALKEVLFREKDWKRCLAGRDNRTKFALSRLKQVVEAMGGLPNVTVNVEGERPLDGALRRAWAYAEAQDMFDRQSQYLENLSGGLLRQIDSIFVESVPDDAEEEFVPSGLEAMTATDPFLMDLNAQNLRPRDYALKLVEECTLNAQQIRAVAPIVCTIDEMWEKRTEASTCFANGQPSERCNCLWLGAGGSGKTWAYTKVLRPLFQRFFGFGRYTAGAPTHAAARLLGAEARTLHKLANISPNSALHRGAIRGQRNKNDALEQQILASLACIVDELSMSAADVYHALGLRFSVKRCENWALDLSRYLQEWFGKMPIGLQLGDFLQLRPAAQASLCEWVEVPSAALVLPLTELQEAEAPEQASNAAELGRLLFKNSMGIVVHFTGTGRFSSCASGQALVAILQHMRQGTAMTDALWAQLQSRVYEVQQLQDLQTAPSRRAFLRAYWGALAWEQVARLQQLRAVLEAEDAGERLYFVQAIDKPTGDALLSSAQVSAALQCLNMTKTGYLIGMCPLFLGMEVRISCILPEPLLTRELPCIVRRIELHPKEPPTPPGAACVVLQYQPLGVLVEVADSDYGQFQVPGDDVRKGHFYVRPVFNKQSAWVFEVAPKQKLRLVRKQVPLAPQRALTHFGLQGITARSGLVAFLNQPPWMKDGDYGLALYVMLSRATKLSDLWLIGVPERPYFEGFLHEHNKTLVDRMSLFERLSVQNEQAAEKYIQKLLWRGNAY